METRPPNQRAEGNFLRAVVTAGVGGRRRQKTELWSLEPAEGWELWNKAQQAAGRGHFPGIFSVEFRPVTKGRGGQG